MFGLILLFMRPCLQILSEGQHFTNKLLSCRNPLHNKACCGYCGYLFHGRVKRYVEEEAGVKLNLP